MSPSVQKFLPHVLEAIAKFCTEMAKDLRTRR
jgi:hypothetical protein